MKTYKLLIPIFDWTIEIIQIESSGDLVEVLHLLKYSIVNDQVNYAKITQYIENEHVDGGEVISCNKYSLMILYPFTSNDKFNNTFNHEKRHVEDNILKCLNINDFEIAGRLSGYLGVELMKLMNK